MPSELELELKVQVNRLANELERRRVEHERLRPYAERVDGRLAVPDAVVAAKLVTAYRHLMAMAEMPWGDVVVKSKLDRLEPNGIAADDKSVAEAVWDGVWQSNALDMGAKLAHDAALMDGRAHATVWPSASGRVWLDNGGSPDGPDVTFDNAATMVVEFREGSFRHREGALRRFDDEDGAEFATLYRRDGIYKFQAVRAGQTRAGTFEAGGRRWFRREVAGEAWPIPNPLGEVPVVELGVNRKLAPGRFTVCHGEFSNATGLMDRINLLTFLGLVLAVSMSFPLRVLFGAKILRDDDGNVLPPFNAYIGGIAQMEDPPSETRIDEFTAADRGALSIYDELAQLASATSTPRHYFPTAGGMSNIAEPTLRAFEAPMLAAVEGSHKPSLSEGHEEILRLGGRMLPEPVLLDPKASLTWAKHQSRSLAENADAFSKIAGAGLPWMAAAEMALGMSQDDIRRVQAEMAGSAVERLFTAALNGPPEPRQPASEPVPA